MEIEQDHTQGEGIDAADLVVIEEGENYFVLLQFGPIMLNANVLLINGFDVESLDEVFDLESMVMVVFPHYVLYLKYL